MFHPSNTARVVTTARVAAALMIVFLMLSLLLVRAHAEKPAPVFDQDKFNSLYLKMDLFYRRLHGCPDAGYPPEVRCSEALGRFDVRTWRVVQEEGEALFVR